MAKMKLQGGFDDLALLELFCQEPYLAKPTEGYWCYQVTDSLGVTLKFGVDIPQESVQIELKLTESTISVLSFELVNFIEITDYINGKFQFPVAPSNQEIQTIVKVELRPQIQVNCATLQRFAYNEVS